jgi:orotate phosphoribosyltransferase
MTSAPADPILNQHQKAFLELALQYEVLKFGEFTLKSGRVSPYFFNLGKIASGRGLWTLAQAYSDTLVRSGVGYDMLFGPAYKGIPLVSAVACALGEAGRDIPFAYNRKEAKTHGEGGSLVGAVPKGRVVIIDDVLTAGTAMREAIALLRAAGAEPVAAMIALDRQERGQGALSAVAEMEAETGVKVLPLITVKGILQWLAQSSFPAETREAIALYQRHYGV